uniref:Chondroitin proteoglycan 4 domain-containing protein n=1 Tax=Ascaris lumbricoides TaxID=6252 RepID=A0A0M3HZD7_ASCLU
MKMMIAFFIITAIRIEGKVRRCHCDEESECRKVSLDAANECAQKCGLELKRFGDDVAAYVECFGEQRSLIVDEEACLKNKIGASCDETHGTSYIKKLDFSSLDVKFEEPKKPAGGSLVQLSFDTLVTFKKYHHCIRKCMTDAAVACYRAKNCGINVPSLATVSKWVDECSGIHPQFYPRQLQACHCMLHKHHVT